MFADCDEPTSEAAVTRLGPQASAIAEAMAGFWRPLAEGKAHRLSRSDLPPDHPARRVGDLGDALILTEDNELIEE